VLDICGLAPDVTGQARARARALHDEVDRLYDQMRAASDRGERDRLRAQAEAKKAAAEKADMEAAQQIFRAKNGGYGPEQMDLHGLYVKEAVAFVDERLVAVDGDLRSGRLESLTIITGAGHHSANGAKIKPEIARLLAQRNLPYVEDGAGGQFVVSFKRAGAEPAAAAPAAPAPHAARPPAAPAAAGQQQQLPPPPQQAKEEEGGFLQLLAVCCVCLYSTCRAGRGRPRVGFPRMPKPPLTPFCSLAQTHSPGPSHRSPSRRARARRSRGAPRSRRRPSPRSRRCTASHRFDCSKANSQQNFWRGRAAVPTAPLANLASERALES
jgi:DNA-nicking Smr family endonuclease